MFSLLGINLVLIALYTFMGHSYRDFITVAFFKSIHILMIVNAKRIYSFIPIGDSSGSIAYIPSAHRRIVTGLALHYAPSP